MERAHNLSTPVSSSSLAAPSDRSSAAPSDLTGMSLNSAPSQGNRMPGRMPSAIFVEQLSFVGFQGVTRATSSTSLMMPPPVPPPLRTGGVGEEWNTSWQNIDDHQQLRPPALMATNTTSPHLGGQQPLQLQQQQQPSDPGAFSRGGHAAALKGSPDNDDSDPVSCESQTSVGLTTPSFGYTTIPPSALLGLLNGGTGSEATAVGVPPAYGFPPALPPPQQPSVHSVAPFALNFDLAMPQSPSHHLYRRRAGSEAAASTGGGGDGGPADDAAPMSETQAPSSADYSSTLTSPPAHHVLAVTMLSLSTPPDSTSAAARDGEPAMVISPTASTLPSSPNAGGGSPDGTRLPAYQQQPRPQGAQGGGGLPSGGFTIATIHLSPQAANPSAQRNSNAVSARRGSTGEFAGGGSSPGLGSSGARNQQPAGASGSVPDEEGQPASAFASCLFPANDGSTAAGGSGGDAVGGHAGGEASRYAAMPPAPSPLSRQFADPTRLVRTSRSLVGKGASSTVFEVQDRYTGTLYAVKCINAQQSKTRREEAQREDLALRKLIRAASIRAASQYTAAMSSSSASAQGRPPLGPTATVAALMVEPSSPAIDVPSTSGHFPPPLQSLVVDASSPRESANMTVAVGGGGGHHLHHRGSFRNAGGDDHSAGGGLSSHNGVNMAAMAASQLSPHIVSQFGSYTDDIGCVHIVMELMRGSMSEISPVPESVAARVAVMVLRGLAYLHDEAAIMHRDIKPSNILFGQDGMFKLTDFGLATSTQHSDGSPRQSMTFLGTVHYMSPERLTGKGHTEKSDIFAFGLTIAEVVLGQHLLQDALGDAFGAGQETRFWRMLQVLGVTNASEGEEEQAENDDDEALLPSIDPTIAPEGQGGAAGGGSSSSCRRELDRLHKRKNRAIHRVLGTFQGRLSDAFREFLAAAMDFDAERRWGAQQLLAHPWIAVHIDPQEEDRTLQEIVRRFLDARGHFATATDLS